MTRKVDTLVTATLVLCAIVTTAIVIHREVLSRLAERSRADSQKPTFVANWKEELANGRQIGSATAAIRVVEFGDFECPFCGGMYQLFKVVQGRHPGQISLTFVHFPLAGHRFALPAARAAECAADQGHFENMYDQLFEGQETFGSKPWRDYATAAGLPNIAAFDACLNRSDEVPLIEAGKALGKRLDVNATPTVIINGWRWRHPPSEQELEQTVQWVLAGRSPVDGKS